MSRKPLVEGTVEPGFEPVRAAFERNLLARRELGAGCALVQRGRPVVDLWGGVRDVASGARWARDTLVLVYSVSKGLAAAALALLHARGLLDYEALVARYWPEFGQAGKEAITVRQLLAHQAGLAAIDQRLDAACIADRARLDTLLARQRPAWVPGTRHAYHAISLGFYQDALARRVDPEQRSIGALVRAEIGRHFGDALFIGLPEGVPGERVAPIERIHPWRLFLHPFALSPRFGLALAWPWSLTAKSVRNPRLRHPAELDAPALRRLELASSNGYATARALASMYGSLATNGAPLGIGPDTLAALWEPPRSTPRGEWDAVFKRKTAFSLGFMKPSAGFRFGASGAAFGAPGVGGSFAYADPDRGSGYAYVTNRLGFNVFDDPREQALRRACEACLDRA